MVLPTPGGPISSTLVASSRNRRVASSRTSCRSTDGWASKSKSEIRQGAGRQANRARLAWRRAVTAVTSRASSRSRNSVWLSCPAPGVVELAGQRLGGRGHAQLGQVAAQLLVDLVAAGHRPASASSA